MMKVVKGHFPFLEWIHFQRDYFSKVSGDHLSLNELIQVLMSMQMKKLVYWQQLEMNDEELIVLIGFEL